MRDSKKCSDLKRRVRCVEDPVMNLPYPSLCHHRSTLTFYIESCTII